MKYSEISSSELEKMRSTFIINGNHNAAREIAEFQKSYDLRVEVIKGRKVPVGTKDIVFWVKRYDPSRHGDTWGIYSYARVGFKDDAGEAHFTSIDNLKVIGITK